MPKFDEPELNSIFGSGFCFDKESRDERAAAAEALVARHVPGSGQQHGL